MPVISSGLEWDVRLETELFKHSDKVDAIEIIPENFFYAEKIQMKDSIESLKKCDKPILFHGVELSIGSADPLKTEHLSNMMRLMDLLEPRNYSEHLSMTEAAGIEIGQLTPLAWSKDLADKISEKINIIQSLIGVPFLIENITNRFVLPYTELRETEFINRILSNTGCGLLLDVTNVFTNSVNHNFDPYEWINNINLESVQQVHLAGGAYDKDNVLEDSHDQSVWDESWDLYRHLIKKAGPIPTIVERTGNIPEIQSLINEVEKARAIQQTYAHKMAA